MAIDQLYNNEKGCFGLKELNIPSSGKIFIFGESYGGKYAPAIGARLIK